MLQSGIAKLNRLSPLGPVNELIRHANSIGIPLWCAIESSTTLCNTSAILHLGAIEQLLYEHFDDKQYLSFLSAHPLSSLSIVLFPLQQQQQHVTDCHPPNLGLGPIQDNLNHHHRNISRSARLARTLKDCQSSSEALLAQPGNIL